MKIFTDLQLKNWGIVDYGVTSEAVPESVNRYNEWVEKDLHQPLQYLQGERQNKRQNLKEHWPEFQSAIVFLFSYHGTHQSLQKFYETDKNWNGLKIASYTLGFDGEDYHNLIKARLISIGEELKKTNPALEYKLTLDTHPVLERDLAYRAGLGWFGKNSMLINREAGSFFIIGSLLLNTKLDNRNESVKELETDHCGQCTACIDACPTEAIDAETRTIIAQDCISTFTIEQFKMETVPSEKMTLKSGWIFGCDICQDVCPWNKRVDRMNSYAAGILPAEKHKMIKDFFLLKEKSTLQLELESMSEGEFKRKFVGTSFERSGRRGLLKNVRLLLKELNIFS
jgi:epoxyqueuosine reductase